MVKETRVSKNRILYRLEDDDYKKLSEILGKEIDFRIQWEDNICKHLKIIYKNEKHLAKVRAEPERWKNAEYQIKMWEDRITHAKRGIINYLLHSKQRHSEQIEKEKKDFFNWFFRPLLIYSWNEVQLRAICKNQSRFPIKIDECKKCKWLIEFDLDNSRIICKNKKNTEELEKIKRNLKRKRREKKKRRSESK